MNKTIKRLVASLVLSQSLVLTSCAMDPGSFYFDFADLKENVVAVELINYNYPDPKDVGNRSDILPFDFNKMEVIETLEPDSYEDFFQELSKIHFHVASDWTKYTDSTSGLNVRMIYASSDFVVCSNRGLNFLGEFNADGSVGELMGIMISVQKFEELIDKYFFNL